MTSALTLVDASVVLSAFDADDRHHAGAARLLADASRSIVTIDLARHEAINVVVRVWKAPQLVDEVLQVLELIAADGGIVEASRGLVAEAAALADRHGISVYDAAYAAAAQARGATLVSCDVRDLVSTGLATTP